MLVVDDGSACWVLLLRCAMRRPTTTGIISGLKRVCRTWSMWIALCWPRRAGTGLGHQLYDELSTMALADGCEVMTAEWISSRPIHTHCIFIANEDLSNTGNACSKVVSASRCSVAICNWPVRASRSDLDMQYTILARLTLIYLGRVAYDSVINRKGTRSCGSLHFF